MSHVGQKRRFGDIRVTSALPLKADIQRKVRHVSKVPEAEVTAVAPYDVSQRGRIIAMRGLLTRRRKFFCMAVATPLALSA